MKHKVHKYVRITIGSKGYTVMKCRLDGCTSFIRVELAVGLKCICWRCGKEFVLDERTVKLVKPHCRDCTKSRLDFKLVALTGV